MLQARQCGLADQFRHAGIHIVIRDVIIRVELRPLRQQRHNHIQQHIHLFPAHRRDRNHLAFPAQEFMHRHQLLRHPITRHFIHLGHHAQQRGLGRNPAHGLHNPAVAGADLLISRNGHPDHVHIGVGVFDHLVQAFT